MPVDKTSDDFATLAESISIRIYPEDADSLLQLIIAAVQGSEIIGKDFTLGPNANPWFGGPPEASDVFPILVVSHAGEVPDWQFDDKATVEGSVTLTAHQIGLKECERLAGTINKAMKVWMDNAGSLSIAAQKVSSIVESNYAVAVSSVRHPSGQRVYSAARTYKVVFNRDEKP